MEAFTQLDGLVVPLDRANVDTDVIIPKQFLKTIKRTGLVLTCLMHGATAIMANRARIIQPDPYGKNLS